MRSWCKLTRDTGSIIIFPSCNQWSFRVSSECLIDNVQDKRVKIGTPNLLGRILLCRYSMSLFSSSPLCYKYFFCSKKIILSAKYKANNHPIIKHRQLDNETILYNFDHLSWISHHFYLFISLVSKVVNSISTIITTRKVTHI